ncbi:hypothetical protein ACUH92_08895 [Dermabacteraceae bacterium CCM 9520]
MMSKKHLAILLGVVVVVAVLVFGSGRETPAKVAPQEQKTTSEQLDNAPAQGEEPGGQEEAALKKRAEEFIALYTSEEPNQEKWLSDIRPYCEEALCETLRSFDRGIARASSKQIVAIGQNQVRVAGGKYQYILHFLDIPNEEEGEGGTTYLLEGIQYSEDLDGQALPLDRRYKNRIRERAREVIREVASQRRGTSDSDRAQGIRAALKDPKRALGIPRYAPAGHAVTVGDVHEISFYAAEQGGLRVEVLFPYQVDGVQKTRWVGMTIFFARGEGGAWVPVDAEQDYKTS